MARYARRAAGPEARCHWGDPNPGYSAKRRLRPGLHRLTDLVADREYADALLPEVGRGAKSTVRQALRGVRRVPSVLAGKPHGGARARRAAGRQIRRRGSLHLSRRHAAFDAVADQLSGLRRVPRKVPGCAYSADQRSARAAAADPNLRRWPRGSTVRQVEVAAYAPLIR